MKRTFAFAKKNFIKMIRAPIFFVFAIIFPMLFILVITIMNKSIGGYAGRGTWFEKFPALVPSAMMLCTCLVMYYMTTLVSKDRRSTVLKRQYASPMRTPEFLFGYTIVGFTFGLLLLLVSYFGGWMIAACYHDDYIPFGKGMLLIVSQFPLLITLIFFGLFLGSFLNNGAGGVCAIMFIFICFIGGCVWNLEASSNGIQTFCRCFPFWPSVYIGREISGAIKSNSQVPYEWDNVCKIGLVTIFVYMALNITLASVFFSIQCKKQLK